MNQSTFLQSKKSQQKTTHTPLAERMRPQSLGEVLGQDHLLGPGKILRNLIERDEVSSFIFWGPPGCGKTTIAYLIAERTKAHFVKFSAVISGINEVKKVMKEAEARKAINGQKTILFIDEIHRFNKAQQDAFLPYVERGDIVLIGATTENPSFHVINALLSRSKVFVLKPLTIEHMVEILKKTLISYQPSAVSHQPKNKLPDARRQMPVLPPDKGGFKGGSPPDKGGQRGVIISPDLLEHIANFSNGDARIALNSLELLLQHLEAKGKNKATKEDIEEALQHKSLQYDKDGEEHYNLISALHKCLRDSDADAALYWLGRMLESGEDPLYIVRRLIRFASEDIGLADPQALVQAVAAQQATHFIGMPECNVILAQAVVYLAKAPKSNALYMAYKAVQKDVYETMNEPVPLVIRNAPTKLMKELDYGKGYKYAHDYKDAQVEQEHLPARLKGRKYYRPTNRSQEKKHNKI